MWFGTDNGVSRFDGYTFQNFGAREGLKDNVVFEMLEDRQGRVWMNTMGGALYYFWQDSIYAYQHNDLIQQYRSRFYTAQKFYVDREETVYICLKLLGILKITKDGKSKLFQSQFHGGKIVMEPEGFFLSSYTNFQDRTLVDSLVQLMNLREQLAPVEFVKDIEVVRTEEFERIKASGDGPIMFAFEGSRYLLYQNFGLYFIDHERISWRRPALSLLTSVLIDNNGSFFLAFNQGGGLQKYASVEALREGRYDQYLNGYSITKAYIDKQGGHWVSSTTHGVFYTSSFDLLIYDEQIGLSNQLVTAVTLNRQDEIFTGLRNGALYRISLSGKSIEKLPPKSNATPVYDLHYDPREEVLWIASGYLQYYQQGEMITPAVWYTPAKGNKRKVIAGAKSLKPVFQQGRMWAVNFRGVNLVDLPNRKYLLNSHIGYNTERFVDRVFVVFEDLAGQVWLGKENGLFNWNDGRPVPASVDHPAFRLRIEDIAQLSDSTLVLGIKGLGVVLWKGKEIRQFTTTDGLTADMIENIHVDEQGQIWVGTLNGLNKLRRRENGQWTIEQINTAHGLPSNAVNMVKTAGREVWVATDRGLVHFRDERRENRYSPPPAVRQVLVNGDLMDKTFTTYTYRQNNLALHFLTINYRQNGRIAYRYSLNPGQKDWIFTQNTSVDFSALQYGHYVFEVQSQNEDGFWSDSATFSFRIHPPFWRTAWFFSLLLLAAGGSVYGLYRYRVRQIRLEAEREAEVVRQMAELERSALRAQMNPHFIFNCLNSISSLINKGDKLSANYYLGAFAKLIRAALNHSRVGKISLEDELQLLENYLKMEQLRFENGFDYDIRLGEAVEPFEIEIPPMLTQPFVENAIIHGLAGKEERGKISLLCELENDLLKISVMDNGVGIEQSKKQQNARESLHKSVGMTITKRRLEMLSGENGSGRVEARELKNEVGETLGTRVDIWIPLME